MEERSWLWMANLFGYNSESSITCINISPVLIYKDNYPFKLIYTDSNGRLSNKNNPNNLEILDSLKELLKHPSKIIIKGFTLAGSFELIKYERLMKELDYSDFIAIQITKDSFATYRHTIEYSKDFYISTPHFFRSKSFKICDDSALEKNLLVYSINCINLVEKSRKYNVNYIEIVYIKDSIQKLWIESISKCLLNKFDEDRTGILQSKIKFNSSIHDKVLSKRNASFSHQSLPKKSPILKPLLRFSNKKFMNYSLAKLSMNIDCNLYAVCHGNYCRLDIQMDTIKRTRKVCSKSYFNLPHHLIKKSISFIKFPCTESTFSEQFNEKYSKILEIFWGRVPYKIKNIKYQLEKSDTTKLCPICYKIYSLVLKIESI